MFERLSKLAELTATSVSRRQFLGRFGGGALAAATALGGLLALPGQAEAGKKRVCGPNSVPQCRGRPVGSLCGTPSRPGRCKGPPDCHCSP
jgi:hypothetical protein